MFQTLLVGLYNSSCLHSFILKACLHLLHQAEKSGQPFETGRWGVERILFLPELSLGVPPVACTEQVLLLPVPCLSHGPIMPPSSNFSVSHPHGFACFPSQYCGEGSHQLCFSPLLVFNAWLPQTVPGLRLSVTAWLRRTKCGSHRQ